MTILELQKRLQELYKENGNIEVLIQNGDGGGDYEGQRPIQEVYVEGEIPNDTVIIS
jgi:hypothetical protein|nr:MAG TPA: hypothetical protein [Caudoviricetes sp.]